MALEKGSNLGSSSSSTTGLAIAARQPSHERGSQAKFFRLHLSSNAIGEAGAPAIAKALHSRATAIRAEANRPAPASSAVVPAISISNQGEARHRYRRNLDPNRAAPFRARRAVFAFKFVQWVTCRSH
jgi:hypothetical protein